MTQEPASASASAETAAAGPRRVLLLANPRARSGATARAAADRLAALGVNVRYEEPAGIERLHAVIAARAPEVDRIVIAGGDGSIAAALPALLEAKKPLAVLPLGTANDLARNLGLPKGLEAQLALAAGGRLRSIDIGCVNGRPFLNAVSIGLGAAVAALHQGPAKRWLGVLNYPRILYVAWRRIRPFSVEIDGDGAIHQGRFVHLAVVNGRFHGGGLEPRPSGSISDGVLDLYALRDGPAFRLMQILAMLRLTGVASEAVFRLEGQRFRITTRHRRRANVDGELATRTPLDISILKAALDVVVPEADATPAAPRLPK